MTKTQIKVLTGFTIDAYLIKEYLTFEFGLEQEVWTHQILYCQNRLIEYVKFKVNKVSNNLYQTPEDTRRYYESLMNSSKYFLLNETNEYWEFATINILVEHCVISD